MPPFNLLADPQHYTPCSTENMHVDHEYRDYWLRHFESHFHSIMRLALDQYGPESAPRIAACTADFFATLHKIHDNPKSLARLDLLVLDQIRQDILIEHALPDPFEKTKARENNLCLALYPKVIRELDRRADPRAALLSSIEGIFAGNIFDLGAGATTKLFAESSPDFFAVRDSVGKKRPWLVDHFTPLAEKLLPTICGAGFQPPDPPAPPYRQAMFFCDNAGSDFVLGVLPFCRWLALRGTRVIIAANRLPALNDMTVHEVQALLPRLQAIDPTLDRLVKDGRIIAIDSGGTAPLIDLREVSEEANVHARETDLLILEGMGRALESNYEATFTTDTLKLAMIKEEIVAQRHGGKNFDTVCRFDAQFPRRKDCIA